ncbi:hypothetical protein [Kamptonema formosum]|uniref:hypothetical protein n=1 Tax=Kamptonema formosum TaxID=331992 RepID=UPI0012D78CB4|nr:hypothetical protein [Kamptonema formosum]
MANYPSPPSPPSPLSSPISPISPISPSPPSSPSTHHLRDCGQGMFKSVASSSETAIAP